MYPLVLTTSNNVDKIVKKHYVLIYDRSGSMYDVINDLVDDLITHVRSMLFDDMITVGWFSGEGEYELFISHQPVSNIDDIVSQINARRSTIGFTCFSEILGAVTEIKSDEEVIMMFFTDGHPVVSNYQREKSSIMASLAKLEHSVTRAVFIGYDRYYNRPLLVEMATAVGGSFVHNSTLVETHQSLLEFIGSNGSYGFVDLPLAKEEIVIAGSFAHNNLYFTPEPSNGVAKVVGDRLVIVTKDDWSSRGDRLTEKDYYVAASLLLSKTMAAEACELLGWLGDQYFVNRIINAFTNEEYGDIIRELKRAIMDEPRTRYRNGRHLDCFPDHNAFCFMDLIRILQADPNAGFLPTHKDWHYQRTSKLAKPKDDSGPQFVASRQQIPTPFDKLVWHSERLNLSIRAEIRGMVDLTQLPIKIDDISEFMATIKDLDLLKNFPTFQYRNFTIIKDGDYNMSELYVTLSASIGDLLRDRGILSDTDEPNVYKLSLKGLPIINRDIADQSRLSAEEYARMSIDLMKCKAHMKVFRAKQSENKTEPKETVDKFLLEHGFRADGSYCPEVSVAKNEACDFYLGKTLEVKIKGYSTIPSVTAVEKKIRDGKRLTPPDALIAEALDMIEKENLRLLILMTNHQITDLSEKLNRCKFGLLLSKQWFKEFDSYDDCTVNVDGIVVSFHLKETKVYFD